ncbi:MAG TPA: hypothetical protein VEZ40_17885 [Pyrinomonadaceae bacterium]|nr:hypothetical protein [Pyrinomonadaceae bacterium]
MKYLIVALILGAFLTIVYLRLRPYIGFARRVLGVVREARGMSAGQGMPEGAAQPKKKGGERLVRCASCGTWLPAARALTLRSTSSNFCSHACMERSAGESSARRAAGGEH